MASIPPDIHQIIFSSALTQSVTSQPLNTWACLFQPTGSTPCCFLLTHRRSTSVLLASQSPCKLQLCCSMCQPSTASIIRKFLKPTVLTKEVYYISDSRKLGRRKTQPFPGSVSLFPWSLTWLKRGVTCNASWTVTHPKSSRCCSIFGPLHDSQWWLPVGGWKD